ncbi:MAG TPA: helix-turn-helix domain-containing protein [Rubrobacteraceae bacterium]|nr:helix-turn-helix domain-containing protein [Rubrobacteraceae bacterium]
MAAKFTRIPKVEHLIASGVPAEAIPTYCALADYSNNKNGLCWPKMETLATTLKRSVRTVQRHVHLLASLGWIELVERRRHKGRFSSYLYRVLHITKTTGHGQRLARRFLYKRRTKSSLNSQKEQISAIDKEHREQTIKARKGEQHTKGGYEWFFE